MHVLVGVGGPGDSLAALDWAIDRAVAAGDRLTAAVLDDGRSVAAREELLDRVDERLDAAPIEATIRHLEGDPGSQLVDVAETEDFDEVVIGGGATSPMGKIKIDSTLEFVLLNSHTTVTLVR